MLITRYTRSAALFLMLAAQPAAVLAQEKPPAEADANALTAAQKQALQQTLQSIENDSKTKAEALAQKLGLAAKSFDRYILSGKPDPELDRKMSADFVGAVTEVVAMAVQLKLSQMREIVKILTPEQRKLLLTELDKPDSNPDLTELAAKVFGLKK